MTTKTNLGQFFSTNAETILKGLEQYVVGRDVCDPFAGKGDLLRWAQHNGARDARGFDVDPTLQSGNVEIRDTLMSMPDAKMIVTNPPYRKLRSGHGDLYHDALRGIIEAGPERLIAIVPVNVLARSSPVRVELLSKYQMVRANVFREPVFDDTKVNVIAFYAVRKSVPVQSPVFHFFPGSARTITLEQRYGFLPGGRELDPVLRSPSSHARRTFSSDSPVVYFRCIDSTSVRIHAERRRGCRIPRDSTTELAIEGDGNVELFNAELTRLREPCESLFLTNFYNSYTKRLPFELCLRLWNHLNPDAMQIAC